MPTETNIFLYVTDAEASARFYSKLLEAEPVAAQPGFAMFLLPGGIALGLWSSETVQPAPAGGSGGGEIGLKVADAGAVDSAHAEWKARGATIAFPPTDLSFGRNFVALDPDGHRLRVYAAA